MARIDFEAVNSAALSNLPSLLCRWLPERRRQAVFAAWLVRFDRCGGT